MQINLMSVTCFEEISQVLFEDVRTREIVEDKTFMTAFILANLKAIKGITILDCSEDDLVKMVFDYVRFLHEEVLTTGDVNQDLNIMAEIDKRLKRHNSSDSVTEAYTNVNIKAFHHLQTVAYSCFEYLQEISNERDNCSLEEQKDVEPMYFNRLLFTFFGNGNTFTGNGEEDLTNQLKKMFIGYGLLAMQDEELDKTEDVIMHYHRPYNECECAVCLKRKELVVIVREYFALLLHQYSETIDTKKLLSLMYNNIKVEEMDYSVLSSYYDYLESIATLNKAIGSTSKIDDMDIDEVLIGIKYLLRKLI